MFNLTCQERNALLFLAFLLITGSGAHFFLKKNPGYLDSIKINQASPETVKVNVNTATREQLLAIYGIGEVIADRIIFYRTENGPFAAIEDLEKVEGIGKKKLEKIKRYLILD
ncbi:MAG: helix-hairpin-helix domain-containing protein [Candidatus Omnitrophica bacterium]|nr:helix-hairpin-helix domain-containing protein [Candidatus Omnitrophota bacterium]